MKSPVGSVLLAVCLNFSCNSAYSATCFAPPVEVPTLEQGSDIVVGDVNNDGFPDFIVSYCQGQGGTVDLGNGDGTFRHSLINRMSPGAYGLALADFNHDGNMDLAAAYGGGGCLSGSRAELLLGNGDGTFQAEKKYWSGKEPISLAPGDFNNDGQLDLLVDDILDGTHYLFFGNGDGTLRHGTRIANAQPPFFGQWSKATDFNKDGNLDFVYLSDKNSYSLVISLGHGDGTFGKHFSYPGGFFAVADLNLDGKVDILVVSVLGGSSQMTVLLGNGDGSMTALAPVSVPYQTNPAIGDLNNDGVPDVVYANGRFANLSFRFGVGDGTFRDQMLTYAKVSQLVKLADFNQDGLLDILSWTGGLTTRGVNVMFNAGQCH